MSCGSARRDRDCGGASYRAAGARPGRCSETKAVLGARLARVGEDQRPGWSILRNGFVRLRRYVSRRRAATYLDKILKGLNPEIARMLQRRNCGLRAEPHQAVPLRIGTTLSPSCQG